ncbi:hypothetical protein B0H11DRAFT_1929909 [Mycena galericulata]|nr:hypothetical protein B0H11DRAFT_1929909 [Mycena galericulata]
MFAPTNSNPRDLNKFIKGSRSFLNPFLPSDIPEVINVGPRCVLLFSEAYLFFSVVFLLNVESRSLSTHHGYLGPHPNHQREFHSSWSHSSANLFLDQDGFFNAESSALPTHLEFPSAHANHFASGAEKPASSSTREKCRLCIATPFYPFLPVLSLSESLQNYISSSSSLEFLLGTLRCNPAGIFASTLLIPPKIGFLVIFRADTILNLKPRTEATTGDFCRDLLVREMTRIRYKVCSPVLREVR